MGKALFTNNASGTLASAIASTGATSLALTAGQGALFPTITGSDYFYATIIDASNNKEIVKVTANAADTFTMVRAQDNTTARTFAIASRVELRPTAIALREKLSGDDAANMLNSKIINGDFRINQRGYVSAAALAAGSYGHDRWKGGASGGDYSFTQLAGPTVITIAANKSLVQVIEDKNVEGGSYTLSWTGTAVGRLTINNATPSGNFAVSPITVSGQTASTVMSLELTGANAVGGSTIATNTGTVGLVRVEAGSSANAFVMDDFSVSLEKCQRYYEKSCNLSVAPGTATAVGAPYQSGSTDASNNVAMQITYKTTKRAAATLTLWTVSGVAGKWTSGTSAAGTVDSTPGVLDSGESGWSGYLTTGAPWVAAYIYGHWAADAEL